MKDFDRYMFNFRVSQARELLELALAQIEPPPAPEAGSLAVAIAAVAGVEGLRPSDPVLEGDLERATRAVRRTVESLPAPESTAVTLAIRLLDGSRALASGKAPRLGRAMQLSDRELAPSIKCPLCERTSHNPNDVWERYCGACHAFHDELEAPP